MYNNHTHNNEIDKSLIFCSRGFNSTAKPITISTRADASTPVIAITPFRKIGSIDVNINDFKNPKILLSISNLISTTITQNSVIGISDINVEVVFRISTVEHNIVHPISPEYIYSNPLTLEDTSPMGSVPPNITEKISNSFEILYCDLIKCDCQECKTYIIEYSSTLIASIGVQGGDGNPSPIFNLSSSISNVSINAIVSESFC